VAGVIYFLIVVPMNQITSRRKKADVVDSTPVVLPQDIALFQEIRDLLKQRA
jgi:large-conductance mechanosensitive channel